MGCAAARGGKRVAVKAEAAWPTSAWHCWSQPSSTYACGSGPDVALRPRAAVSYVCCLENCTPRASEQQGCELQATPSGGRPRTPSSPSYSEPRRATPSLRRYWSLFKLSPLKPQPSPEKPQKVTEVLNGRCSCSDLQIRPSLLSAQPNPSREAFFRV